MTELGISINRYVSSNGIPKRQLAEKAEITENALSLSLNGKRRLLADEYIRICDALCVPYNKFIASGQNERAMISAGMQTASAEKDSA